MYSLRVNTKTKELVEEVAAMVDLSVSAIIRKVRKKVAACLDTRSLSVARYQKLRQLDESFKNYNSQLINERRALYMEV